MTLHTEKTLYNSTSQRIASIYTASLTEFKPVIPAGLDPQQHAALAESERDFHLFLRSLYAAFFQSPQQFGLPLSSDMCIKGGEKDPKQFKQDVKQQLDKPKAMIEQGMDFLMLIGVKGILQDAELLVPQGEYADLIKELKIKKPFLAGLAGVGLQISPRGEAVAITSTSHPAMLLALKNLAEACSRYENTRLGKFNFARADFRALDGKFSPAALDLYQYLGTEDLERVTWLHQFMTGMRYFPEYQIYGIFGWEVQYQGPKKIKASPLLRVHYEYRHVNPLRVDIKCVSVNRLIPLIYSQPRYLLEDFSSRLNTCNGEKCNWCHDKKGLGPSVFEFDGVKRTVCWYHNPDIDELNENSMQVIQQYTRMHEALLPVA